jgi:hypothetical protein
MLLRKQDYFLFFSMALIIMTSIQSSTAKDQINVDSIEMNKYIEAYRRFFEVKTSANLFNTQAEDTAARKTRYEILNYINEHKLNTNEENIEKEWENFIQKNYKNPIELDKKLSNLYLNLDYVKKKFIENQDLTIYFNTIVIPRIKEDIELRKDIFLFSLANNINFNHSEFKKALYQLAANFGGEEKLRDFMKRNSFESTDLTFLIETDILREKIAKFVLEQELSNNEEIAKELKNSITNHFYNFSQKNQPNYFFKQIFIKKDIESAMDKIKQARENFNSTEELTKIEGIEILEMSHPVSKDCKLYHPLIKEAVLNLNKDPLFVSREISPIITTNNGYHLVQISSIEIPEQLSYKEAYEQIEKKMLNEKYNEVSKMISSYFSK